MKRIYSVLAVVGVTALMASTAFGQAAGPGKQGGQGGQGGPGQGRQGGPGGGMGRGFGGQMNPELQKKVDDLRKKVMNTVGLTADQQKKVLAAEKVQQDANMKMMEKIVAEMQKAAQAGGGAEGERPRMSEEDRDKMQAERKKIRDAYQTEMVKIMGKEKVAQYEKLMRSEMQKVMKEMGFGGGQGGQGGGQRRGGGGGAAGGGAKTGGGKAGGGL